MAEDRHLAHVDTTELGTLHIVERDKEPFKDTPEVVIFTDEVGEKLQYLTVVDGRGNSWKLA